MPRLFRLGWPCEPFRSAELCCVRGHPRLVHRPDRDGPGVIALSTFLPEDGRKPEAEVFQTSMAWGPTGGLQRVVRGLTMYLTPHPRLAKVWFCWEDLREITKTHRSGPSLSILLCFISEAVKPLDNHWIFFGELSISRDTSLHPRLW